jgi:uncharacterized protein (DUF2252 family)
MTKTASKASIREANKAYEAWLRAELRSDIVEADLKAKWDKMASGPFPFLRATYWRWAETILDVCPELKDAPETLAVGDIHLENYGVWRDDDGRLVWGVNDFDEAAEMPYALDLVRLATSAALARPSHEYSTSSICVAILEGYRDGLKNPRPFVLDETHARLRELLIVSEQERAHFWDKMAALRASPQPPPGHYRKTILSAMPDGAEILKFTRRTAGTGSLGRPRWVGIADWRGGTVVREAKALVPSGWTLVPGRGSRKLRCLEIAMGRYRAPDPWYDVRKGVVVRRLSPNSRKIEVKEQPDELLDPRMLRAMAHELANLHIGTGNRVRAIEKDFAKRKANWLHDATVAATKFVTSEFKTWTKR